MRVTRQLADTGEPAAITGCDNNNSLCSHRTAYWTDCSCFLKLCEAEWLSPDAAVVLILHLVSVNARCWLSQLFDFYKINYCTPTHPPTFSFFVCKKDISWEFHVEKSTIMLIATCTKQAY